MISVVVVDDDFRVADLHADLAERAGPFRVVARVHTASAALDAVARHAPDLVLLDVYLPDGSGLDVLRRLRGPDGPAAAPDVLLISAARDRATLRAAMQAGALHLLIKPVDFDELAERLRGYAELHARRAGEGEVDQREVDALFGLLRRGERGPQDLPAGAATPTGRAVAEAVAAAPDGLSALEVAGAVGVSRATAQRYLAALARAGAVELALRYGSAGRPEHRYRVADRPTGAH